MQGMSGILLIVVMIALMYFMMIRPQQKQRSQHQQMVSQLKKGDHVITIGRLHGVVDEVNNANKTVVLDCEGIFLTFDLAAVASVNAGGAQPAAAKAAPAEEKPAASAASEETPQATDDAKNDAKEDAPQETTEPSDSEEK